MNSHGKEQGIWHHILFSKTSCFVNIAFKNPPLACVLCRVSFAKLLPFVSDESL